MSVEKKRVLVLDATVAYSGYDPFMVSEEQYTTSKIMSEIKKNSKLAIAVNLGVVKIRDPSENVAREIIEMVKNHCEEPNLSDADISVLALAYEFSKEGANALIISDDYSLQNMAKILGLKVSRYGRPFIRHILYRVKICEKCKRKYSPDYPGKTCEICGGRILSKVVKRVKVYEKSSQGN